MLKYLLKDSDIDTDELEKYDHFCCTIYRTDCRDLIEYVVVELSNVIVGDILSNKPIRYNELDDIIFQQCESWYPSNLFDEDFSPDKLIKINFMSIHHYIN